ncbi:MAG: HPr-rel-A system PqqD family peptide chaperone [Chloroflexi bacterium]|nr:HPr-rel-A system PqqD family peptide chaperone [Chloroflexota bacterium]MCH8869214.1 HPr-rel-A system PqqD family peptide chaperone [Chloroflexota bacterium]MCI0796954.1 HPr-rel-A system PqqD family peptide chaperone [Chloroflexota bacterium]MCI0822761.1 HPr-rel-A system PqqD family peptide chaperone [Chloroflexota bacterium]MCI0840591.1 HPr-rel-A system PqqD family peptide chaperone [Chloroflexota bacterium]
MDVARDRPKGREDISEELIDQDLFLYDEGTGAVHQLNSGAAMVWLLCDGAKDVAAIVEEILQSSTAEPEQVLTDVQNALQMFDELGLLANE